MILLPLDFEVVLRDRSTQRLLFSGVVFAILDRGLSSSVPLSVEEPLESRNNISSYFFFLLLSRLSIILGLLLHRIPFEVLGEEIA